MEDDSKRLIYPAYFGFWQTQDNNEGLFFMWFNPDKTVNNSEGIVLDRFGFAQFSN